MAHSLYELTLFGFDASDVEVNIKAEIELVNERLSEIENSTAEEIELQHEQFKRIAAENEKIYEMLLSSQTRVSSLASET